MIGFWKHINRAYVIFILCILFIFYKYLLEVSPSVMSADFLHYFKMNAANLGNVVSCYYYAYFLMQIPAGMLLDHYSPRYVMSLYIIICVVGTIIMATAETSATLAVGRFVIGLGAAIAVIGAFKLITIWFPAKRFAFLAGLTMCLGILGAVFGESPLAILVAKLNWNSVLMTLAGAGLVLVIIFYLLVRDNGPYSTNKQHQSTTLSMWMALKRVLSSPQSWILSLYSGLAFAPMTTLGGLWGIPFLQHTFHLPKGLASQIITMIFFGFGLGCPFYGWLSDYIGRRKPIIVVGTTLAFFLLLLLVVDSYLSVNELYVLLFSYGFFSSAFIVSFSMIREVNPILCAALALGLMNSFNAFFSGLADPLLGYILDITSHGVAVSSSAYPLGDFRAAMFSLIGYVGLAILLFPFIKETHCKQNNEGN